MDTSSTSIIDAHIHIWDFASYRNTEWLNARPDLRSSYLPPDLQPLLRDSRVKEGIIIEADRTSYAYNIWWLEVTEYCPYLKAVVLGADLLQDSLRLWLEAFTQWPGCKGIRSRLIGPAKEWTGHPMVSRAIKMLTDHDLVLELQVASDQLDGLGVLLEHHPQCRVVLDACAAPPSAAKERANWEGLMRLLAAHEQLFIKCSCIQELCGGDESSGRELIQFLSETFGPERLIWGSGWPVLPAGKSYQQALEFSRACMGDMPALEQYAIFGGNAQRIYRLA